MNKDQNSTMNRKNRPCNLTLTNQIETNSNLHQRSPVLIDSNNEKDEGTSVEISEDEDDDDEGEENQFQPKNILQNYFHRPSLHQLLNSNQNGHITLIQAQGIIRTSQSNNDQMLAHTMAVLAAKHQHRRTTNSSTPSENEILTYVGPCPLYSIESSFGLDMNDGLSNYPCRHILAGGGGHLHCPPLWQHLTSFHNFNFHSSSLVICHLLLHSYSFPTPKLFPLKDSQSILRTTPRYSLMKLCPLTRYDVHGIQFEHRTRLCSGYTYNSNIYSHLISFHQMTNDAALRLSRAIAFHDHSFRFNANEILVEQTTTKND